MMAATLTMRMQVREKAPPVVFRRGFGVRGGGLDRPGFAERGCGIEVQAGEPGEFRGGGDDQVRDGGARC